MRIVLNGEQKTVGAGLTVTQLLDELGLADRRVAVEINLEVVPRSEHARRQIKEGDRVEVVFAIGGG